MTPKFDMHTHVWIGQFEDFIVGTKRSGKNDQLELLLELMDKYGIEKNCLIGACAGGHTGNNILAADLSRKYPDRFVMFSEIQFTLPERDEILELSLSKWPAKGIRYCAKPQDSPTDWQGKDFDAFWSKINDAELCFVLNIGPGQIAQMSPLVERWKKIKWIFDHMGRPRYDMSDEEYQPVLELSQYTNVFVKISAFYAFTQNAAEYPYRDLSRFVLKLRDAYGASRLMWGSDTPPSLDFGSFEQTFKCLNHIEGLSNDDLEWILGKTAQQLFA